MSFALPAWDSSIKGVVKCGPHTGIILINKVFNSYKATDSLRLIVNLHLNGQ